jgi:chemotaxis protein methyltransferase CheR
LGHKSSGHRHFVKRLSIAKAGIYAGEKLSDLPAAWKKRYFKPYDGENQILCERIRNEVIFSRLNLMDAVSRFAGKCMRFSAVMFMIYFDNETKDNLVERLYDITEPAAFCSSGILRAQPGENTLSICYAAVYRKE